MREYLKEFFTIFDYDAPARAVLGDSYERVSAARGEAFGALLDAYEKDADTDFGALLEGMSTICKEIELPTYAGHALLLACMSRRLRALYRERGMDEQIWKNSMLDLKYKIEECRLVYGEIGTFVASWFGRFYNMTRFALGRLQFEIIPLSQDYAADGYRLKAGDSVINVHIPRTGTPLCHDEVQDAYRQAAALFAPMLGKDTPVVFVCHSWLLFEKHKAMLSPTSNIRRFMEDYTLIHTGEYDDYSQLWRLFDCQYTGNVDDLPADSSLRRAYIDLIRRKEKTGFALGIYLYQKVLDEQTEA